MDVVRMELRAGERTIMPVHFQRSRRRRPDIAAERTDLDAAGILALHFTFVETTGGNPARPAYLILDDDVVDRARAVEDYKAAGKESLVQDITEEFFWDIEVDAKVLTDLGLSLETRQFSALSWGLVATVRR